MESTLSFGYWIRRQRKALDLTQQALAERVGCSLAAIKKIEGDERRPSRQIAERLADILYVPADQREIFIEVARGLRPVDELLVSHEPIASARMPTGIVTFLFTDIEGSTQLWEKYPQAMSAAHARHDQILQDAIQSNNGHLFQVVGDEFCAAFDTAEGAVQAAVKSQLDLHAENWGETPIYVRMGIHTGKAELQDDGHYQGYVTLSHAQRVMSVGHGGQVVLSSTTQQLVQDELPEGVEVRDLGQHQLKDLSRPEPLFQLSIAGLPPDFPPLDTPSFRHNLPVQLTSFVGREKELKEIKSLLQDTHLLTLTGPGGTGKTRLSLQLSSEVLKEFPDGVWLVELAPLGDSTLVVTAVASTLGVREQPGRTLLDALMDYVRAKNMLLLLDNCEHLIETCSQLTDTLLRTAPRLKILATSREALGISGETAYRVPSLRLPDKKQLKDLEALSRNDCVHLFVDRAVAALPSFRLKEKNVQAIADICRRLDGIPLAIELAAARTKVFPPEEIASRLDDRFRLLTGGSRTALERHQTLFALIEWSHNLLSEAERILLRRISVFAGDWSFEAAETVCAAGIDEDLLDLLTHLVDKSLVVVEEEREKARYRLPETIRQYARDKLFESGEVEKVRDHHLDFFLHLAETAEPHLRGQDQLEWLDRVETEHDNFRTALAWSLESRKSELALQLAGALYYFWLLRGFFSEGLRWLEEALALSEGERREKLAAGNTIPVHADAARRAKALYSAGYFHLVTLDLEKARPMVEESLSLWRELGDKWGLAVTLELAGLMWQLMDNQTGILHLQEGVSLARQVEDPWPLALCLIRLGDSVKVKGTDMVSAQQFLEEGVAMARIAGDRGLLSEGLRELGTIYYSERNFTAAASAIEEALVEARAIGSIFSVVLALAELVSVSCLQNNVVKAKGYCSELWAISQETGAVMGAALSLVAFGFTASFGGEPEQGVHLLAATDAILRQHGVNFVSGSSPFIKVYKQALDKARSQLGSAAFELAWAEGQNMTLDQALTLATKDENQELQFHEDNPKSSPT